MSCLDEFYSSTTRAEILIHLVNTQPGDVLIEKGFTKFQAQIMLKNITYRFNQAQKTELMKIANP